MFPYSIIKNKLYNIFLIILRLIVLLVEGKITEKTNKYNLGEYYLCSEECNKNYYIDILCASNNLPFTTNLYYILLYILLYYLLFSFSIPYAS